MDTKTVYVQSVISFIGIAIQLFIAERSKRQLASQSKDTLDLQRLVSHRTTASFIADKRQKWIDELRTDMAFHLALSQEIVWKWDAARSRSVLAREHSGGDQDATDQQDQTIADELSKETGARDREHQERHLRLKFRLNPKEPEHIVLRSCLDDIRKMLSDTQSAPDREQANALIRDTKGLIDRAADLTEQVLKAEWTRVKQEVAYPEALMATIPKPPGA